jgi:ATP-dependent protease ClpP protease subunit
MRNNDIEQIIELIPQDSNQSMIKTHRQQVSAHTVFFDQNIGEPSKYRELIHLLYLAEEFDQFVFVINSSGGDLDGALSIIEGIKATNAKIRAIITGKCHSAASIIALNCDQVMVTDAAHMLVHTASYGAYGSTGQIKSNVDFSTKQIKHILEHTYAGFLTPAEISDVHKGVEFWFDAKEIEKRLQSKNKFLEAAAKPKTKVKPKDDGDEEQIIPTSPSKPSTKQAKKPTV